jgi:tripartite-type tricarboxylate transporter receptor subunit TctC
MRTLSIGIALLVAAGLADAQGQDFPNRPITVVVPFPAGGPTDAIMRNLGERMRASLGQPLVVEYVTGAAGAVGTRPSTHFVPGGWQAS